MFPSIDALSSDACEDEAAKKDDDLVSIGGAHYPFGDRTAPIIAPHMLLLLCGDLAALVDSIRVSVSMRHIEPGARFVGAIPMDSSELALLDAEQCRWILITPVPNEHGAGNTTRRRADSRLCGALDAVRYGELGYISTRAGHMAIVELHNAFRVRRIYPSLLGSTSLSAAAIAMGPSTLYSLVQPSKESIRADSRWQTHGCELQLLERHARRSVSRYASFSARCSGIAPRPGGGGLVALDDGGGLAAPTLHHVIDRNVPASHRNGSVLWRCHSCCLPGRRCSQLSGLAVIGSYAYVIEHGGGSSGSGGSGGSDGSGGRQDRGAVLRAIDLSDPQGPVLLDGIQHELSILSGRHMSQSKLLSPTYLTRPLYGQIALHAKTDDSILGTGSQRAHGRAARQLISPQNASDWAEYANVRPGRLSMLGAVDIEAARAALLQRWRLLWGDPRKRPRVRRRRLAATTASTLRTSAAEAARARVEEPHAFDFLFPGNANIHAVFRNTLNAKLLFSASADRTLPQIMKLMRMVGHNSTLAQFRKVSRLQSRVAAGALRATGPVPDVCFVLPAWRQLSTVIRPLLNEVVGRRLGLVPSGAHVWRVQLTRMPEGSEIVEHQDRGNYVQSAHRVHIPLVVPRCLRFEYREVTERSWLEVPMRESVAFEINNRVPHRVLRKGPHERVTLIVDAAEKPCVHTIEVAEQCTGWDDPDCLIDFDVTPDEW